MDSSNYRQLMRSKNTGTPAFSPNGTRIAFEQENPYKNIWVMSANGLNKRPLMRDRALDTEPSWGDTLAGVARENRSPQANAGL